MSDTTLPTPIRHPAWCQHVPEGAPYAGDPVGSQTFYDRLAPPEQSSEHQGREYRLDAGESFAYSVSATATQMYDLLPHGVETLVARIRLSIVEHEVVGTPAAAWLTPDEVDGLIAMLLCAKRDLSLSDG
jgi:hypothetical protein